MVYIKNKLIEITHFSFIAFNSAEMRNGFNFTNKEHHPFDSCNRWRTVEQPFVLVNHQTHSKNDASIQPS